MIEKRVERTNSDYFEQVFMTPTGCRYARRRVTEALRRIRDWFNRNLKREEILPTEFSEIEIKNQNDRAWDLWDKHYLK